MYVTVFLKGFVSSFRPLVVLGRSFAHVGDKIHDPTKGPGTLTHTFSFCMWGITQWACWWICLIIRKPVKSILITEANSMHHLVLRNLAFHSVSFSLYYASLYYTTIFHAIFICFSEEEISNMRSELEKYGIQMPAFSKIGGILANELSVDEAACKSSDL